MSAMVDHWLQGLLARGGSDLHLSPGQPPTGRIAGDLANIDPTPLAASQLESLVAEATTPEQRATLSSTGDVRLPYAGAGSNFRVHVCRTAAGLSVVFHHRPKGVDPTALGIPDAVMNAAAIASGLTLIVGPAGSGISTTALTLVEAAAAMRPQQIVVVETPTEVRPLSGPSTVTYKSVGLHAPSLPSALRSAMGEGADLIYVSDIQPGPSFTALLHVATSGPQVIATMSAPDATSALELVASSVSPTESAGMLNALSASLAVLMTQHLLPNKDGSGRIPAFEVVVGTPPVRAAVREGRFGMMGALIQTGQGDGMQALDANLGHLVKEGLVDIEHAAAVATDPESLRNKFPATSGLSAGDGT